MAEEKEKKQKKVLENVRKKLADVFDRRKRIMMLAVLLTGIFAGFLIRMSLEYFNSVAVGEPFQFRLSYLFSIQTILIGIAMTVFVYSIIFINMDMSLLFTDHGKRLLEGEPEGIEKSPLEHSRFMTEKERDDNFPYYEYDQLAELTKVKQDGVPMRAVEDENGKLEINFFNGVHALIIGATGSGKTTTFINPMIQLLAATNCGSSMIMTDPKGELFDLHSKYLKERGYDVRLLDLRDTYNSSRWNPLGSIWDMYQEYVEAGKGIIAHTDDMAKYPDLKMDSLVPEGTPWIEYRSRGFSDIRQAYAEISVARQKIYDEMYEDLSDLVAGICPITNEKDPLWEKGARSIVQATCLAMLEDSEKPELGMTKERFNFFNVNRIVSNSADNYAVLKKYFEGRDPLSQAVSMSKQVLSAADQTLSSYMSITFDKLSIFNDRGICGLTSDTDIVATDFAFKPTALFMKIPDEKDTRHGLAALFVLSMYKALVKVASTRDDLSLPRNVYFILDEFGNMPKIEKFGQMITVGRSRKIWFNMVVQSYSQLNNVYGETTADIIKSNCGMKMFIGSNDIGTCKEFSELCGNMTVRTTSTSAQVGGKEGDYNLSSQTQVRPLIYPSELQKLNNKISTGNSIIVTFGNYPLKTKYTPSYLCKSYHFGRMSTEELRANMFNAEEAAYDVEHRNRIMVDGESAD